MNIQRFCVCGQKIKDKHELCTVCENIYGARSSWPEWLKFMVNDMKREYRQERSIDSHETTFTDLGLNQFN